MPERLQSSVRIHRQRTLEIEESVQNVLPGSATRTEAQILVQDKLRRREAVVDLGEADLVVTPACLNASCADASTSEKLVKS